MGTIKGEREEGETDRERRKCLYLTSVRGKEQAESHAAQLGRQEAASCLWWSVFELPSSLTPAAGVSNASALLATLRKVHLTTQLSYLIHSSLQRSKGGWKPLQR